MGLIKFLPFILLAVAGFILLKKFRKPNDIKTQQSFTSKMVACSTCETHVPESETIMQNGKIYCSKGCL